MSDIPVSAASVRAQVGDEAGGACGTKVSATVALGSVKITPGYDIETEEFKSSGAKMPTVIVYGAEQGALSFEGRATYEELTKFIRSLAAAAATTVPSMTVEVGVPGDPAADIYLGAVVTNWTLKGDTKSVNISGNMFSKSRTTGAMTAALSIATQTPILNKHVSISLDGTAKTNVKDWEISLTNLWSPEMFVGSATAGGACEGDDISGTVTLTLEATTENKALVDNRAKLPLIIAMTDGQAGHTITITADVQFKKGNELKAVGKVYAIGLQYSPMQKATGNIIDITKT